MADNIELNAGTGGATLATDDAGVAGHVQLVKLALSADGSATPITADANGMEVQGAGTAGTAAGGVVTVQGVASMTPVQVTWNGTAPPIGAGTEAAALRVTVATDSTGVVSVDDNAGSLTVDNAALAVVGGGVEATALRVTVASDSTGVLSVDDNGASLTVDNAGLTSLNGAIAGTEVQVDVVAALPAGTNAIGKLAANSGVDIGDVDILSIAAGDNNIGNVDLASAIPAGTAYIGKVLPTDRDVTLHTAYAKKYYTSAGAATDGIIWSPAAGTRWHVVSLFLNVSAAATVTLEDDLAGGDSPVMKMELAANSGVVMNFSEQYPLASGEDAADLIITTSAGNVYVTVTGYEI